MEQLKERFLRYVAIDTQSAEGQESVPSTKKQFDLANLLVKELKEMGVSDVRLDEEHAYVYASLPANTGKAVPAIGFIAHMDTSDAMSGANVKARCIPNYDGNDVTLNEDLGIVLSATEFPALKELAGKEIIVTDGTTLLGADDKAGVAEIMTMVRFYMNHPEAPHGKICVSFTPDEEVGRGTAFFDIPAFGAEIAYTVDGSALGELEYECFNGASAVLNIAGKSIHPGSAKGKMINALAVGMEFHSLLPVHEVPEATEGYEGFSHLVGMEGEVEHATMAYIIRDHDREKFEEKKAFFATAAAFINAKYGAGTIALNVKDSYYNMKEQILPHMELIDRAKKIMKEMGVEPVVSPIRGGTDGAALSYRGLPCPNLCTGGANYHGKFEYVCVDDMKTVAELLIRLAAAE